MDDRPRFHLAIPVDDLAAARRFYGGILGCPEGRSSETWVDFDLCGHQLVAHMAPRPSAETAGVASVQTNAVDGQQVPVPHFGLLLERSQWDAMTAKITAAGWDWVIEPTVRFEGRVGEQRTAFCFDPAGNALELKCFADDGQVFSS